MRERSWAITDKGESLAGGEKNRGPGPTGRWVTGCEDRVWSRQGLTQGGVGSGVGPKGCRLAKSQPAAWLPTSTTSRLIGRGRDSFFGF